MPRAWLFFVALFFAAVAPIVARASMDENIVDPSSLFVAAEEAERSMQFAEAVRLYAALLHAAPSHGRAPRARARLEDLRAHDEGDFAPLARLETVRRDPALAADPRAIEALERDADSFPPGRVRAEARLLAGTAWLGRLGDPSRAIEPLAAVVSDVDADLLLRRLALSQLVEARRAIGDLSGAVADVDAFPDLLPAVGEAVHREARRVWIRRVAIALVASVIVLGGLATWRLARATGLSATARNIVRPLSIGCALWLALMGALLARAYDASDPSPFIVLGAGVIAIDIAARAWSAAVHLGVWYFSPEAGECRPRGGWAPSGFADRAGERVPSRMKKPRCVAPPFRAALCITAVIAAAFLALDASDPAYLDSFGL